MLIYLRDAVELLINVHNYADAKSEASIAGKKKI